MGITQLLDKFYIPIPEDEYRKRPHNGQFCWVSVPYLDHIPKILDVQRADPSEHYATKFEIRPVNAGDFKKKNRLPIKMLKLRETEELIVHKAKRRPCIIIDIEATCYPDVADKLRSIGKTHLQQRDSLLVIPLYGAERDEHGEGFPEIMVARIKALMYKQFFFFPKKGAPLSVDSIGRLDRLQSILYHNDTCKLEPFALSEDAFNVLLSMIRLNIGSRNESELDTIKEIVIDTLPKEFHPL